MVNHALLNYADYESISCIKRLVKGMLNLYKLAEKGDMIAFDIYLDLEGAINNPDVLTDKQADYLLKWVEGYTLQEIAVDCNTSKQSISCVIGLASKNIKKHLHIT